MSSEISSTALSWKLAGWALLLARPTVPNARSDKSTVVPDSFTGSQTCLLDHKRVYWIANVFTGSQTCLLDRKRVYWIANVFTGSQTCLLDRKRVYWIANVFTGSQTCLLDRKRVYWIANVFTGSQTCLLDRKRADHNVGSRMSMIIEQFLHFDIIAQPRQVRRSIRPSCDDGFLGTAEGGYATHQSATDRALRVGTTAGKSSSSRAVDRSPLPR